MQHWAEKGQQVLKTFQNTTHQPSQRRLLIASIFKKKKRNRQHAGNQKKISPRMFPRKFLVLRRDILQNVCNNGLPLYRIASLSIASTTFSRNILCKTSVFMQK